MFYKKFKHIVPIIFLFISSSLCSSEQEKYNARLENAIKCLQVEKVKEILESMAKIRNTEIPLSNEEYHHYATFFDKRYSPQTMADLSVVVTIATPCLAILSLFLLGIGEANLKENLKKENAKATSFLYYFCTATGLTSAALAIGPCAKYYYYEIFYADEINKSRKINELLYEKRNLDT